MERVTRKEREEEGESDASLGYSRKGTSAKMLPHVLLLDISFKIPH